MEKGRRTSRLSLLTALLAAGLLSQAYAGQDQPQVKQEMVGVGITEKLGHATPLDATFTDHRGRKVTLGDLLKDGRPIVLSLVYYRCPGLCSMALSGLSDTLRQMAWKPGDKYRVITVSFDPSDTFDVAAAKRANYLQATSLSDEAAWVFLTGDAANIQKLTEAVGFKYIFNKESGQFSHDSAAIVLTPDGRISRYLRGVFYDPQTLKMSLVEASDGRIGTLSDQVWMKVCGYDASKGRYVVMARSVLAIGGVVTIAALILTVGLLLIREHSQRNKNKRASEVDVQPHPV